jgi:positive regulator of sigma E activity
VEEIIKNRRVKMNKKCFYWFGLFKIFTGFSLLGLALGIILKPQCEYVFIIGSIVAGISMALIIIGFIMLRTYKRLDDLMKDEL